MKESYLMPTDKQQQVSPGLKISRRRENILDYPCNKIVSKKEFLKIIRLIIAIDKNFEPTLCYLNSTYQPFEFLNNAFRFASFKANECILILFYVIRTRTFLSVW